MDTGVGADAYSIIEQGKVDAMLLANPMERRTVFEEAAGVAKYRQRRAEAQRKLERTEANLTIAREQLESTERRLRLVKGQAAKARQFQVLDAELKALRMCLAVDQFDDLHERLLGLTGRLADLSATRSEAEAQLAQIESAMSTTDLITVIYRQYLSSNLAAPENDPPLTLTVLAITADVFRIRATCGFGDLVNKRFPSMVYTADQFPGLIAT
jgi:DNA repair exonuclease SbcCD ATPase subunit